MEIFVFLLQFFTFFWSVLSSRHLSIFPTELYAQLYKHWVESSRFPVQLFSKWLSQWKLLQAENSVVSKLKSLYTSHVHKSPHSLPPLTHLPTHTKPSYSGTVGLERYQFHLLMHHVCLKFHENHTITHLSLLPSGISVEAAGTSLHRHYRLYRQPGCQCFWKKSCQLWL